MLLIQIIIKCILPTAISIFLLIPSSKANDSDEKQEVISPIKLTDLIKNVPSQAPVRKNQISKQAGVPKNQMEINNSGSIEMAASRSFDVNGNIRTCNTDQKSNFIEFEERQCKSSRGEYLNIIELADGTKHREEGIIVDGKFTIRGYFHSKADPNYLHFYVHDDKGIHFFNISTQGPGIQQYGIDDEDDGEVCSVRGDSCISQTQLLSMIG